MGDTFDILGSFKLASSGRSLKCRIVPPNSVFPIEFYIGLKDLEQVIKKRKPNGTIYILKES